ncbi:hypothetical protein HDF19_08505 [Mucilaginibacter sp. E4BP6]|uniref:hypothetical protein n=1 Tax=Mucilaginibacter sp. E4BP6 TaxID=2723089 RepID=UPI0015CD2527|nr:hypothetical protein [Mucilaginibacter sp. E4BP6]NYE68568.1 hypothetical protein [Mucilaginibacter sp. E4BP6]
MKRNTKITLGIASAIVVGVLGYLEFLNITYVNRTIKAYTLINDYALTQKAHDSHQWYAQMSISESDGERLLHLHHFKQGYNTKVIAGKSQNDYIKDCPNCWYYLDDKGHGIYGYVLYCLSENKKQLEIYEEFGD